MFWVTPVVVYAALACATVKPPAAPKQMAKPPSAAPAPTPLPAVPDWMFICKILNEQGVQKHPSLNPG